MTEGSGNPADQSHKRVVSQFNHDTKDLVTVGQAEEAFFLCAHYFHKHTGIIHWSWANIEDLLIVTGGTRVIHIGNGEMKCEGVEGWKGRGIKGGTVGRGGRRIGG